MILMPYWPTGLTHKDKLFWVIVGYILLLVGVWSVWAIWEVA